VVAGLAAFVVLVVGAWVGLTPQPAHGWSWPVSPLRERPPEITVVVERYRPPVDAPVLDPFRPPPEPWMAGNRGIEYGTQPGAVVRAIGSGVVRFTGMVAGRLVITVQHPDGLRSSYLPLEQPEVSAGQRVRAGQRLGLAAGPLHLGVRRGERYLDPALLWGRPLGQHRSVLVPTR
jgi:murein DD-endopeptidase MepM/ murein hydrolase activator NlpD